MWKLGQAMGPSAADRTDYSGPGAYNTSRESLTCSGEQKGFASIAVKREVYDELV